MRIDIEFDYCRNLFDRDAPMMNLLVEVDEVVPLLK